MNAFPRFSLTFQYHSRSSNNKGYIIEIMIIYTCIYTARKAQTDTQILADVLTNSIMFVILCSKMYNPREFENEI